MMTEFSFFSELFLYSPVCLNMLTGGKKHICRGANHVTLNSAASLSHSSGADRRTRVANPDDENTGGRAMTSCCLPFQMFPDTTESFPIYQTQREKKGDPFLYGVRWIKIICYNM